MSTPGTVRREGADTCPGALTVHEAADGLLVRVRLAGGQLSGGALRALALAADDLGDGRLELTSRGNVQLRGLAPGDTVPLGERLALAGLLPSATHERVRNIVASPLAGVDRLVPSGPRGGNDAWIGVEQLVRDLDRELCARPGLAALPGRFLFAVDDGRGDVADLGADITMTCVHDAVLIAANRIPAGEAVATALRLAEAFLEIRSEQGSHAWRIAELAGGIAAVTARAGLRAAGGERIGPQYRTAEPVGVIEQPNGRQALVVLAPLGRLTVDQALLVAGLSGTRGLRLTPWHSIVIADLADASAAQQAARTAGELGLGVDAQSPWYR
ncbi:MAG: precorrin-3B synthase, partial [Actinomycetota bacterium]|nr:precorrin-3B synthase [Actinomycetota bacterium]